MKKCKLIAIAAVSVDGVIGIGDNIPWRIPEDFKHFRDTTMGNMLIVGYNTYKTLPPKALEGREYMVVCGDNPVVSHFDKIYRFKKLDTILKLIDEVEFNKVFIGGGAMLYESMIDRCDECIITWVNKNYPGGDKRFPIDKLFANFVAYEMGNWQKSKNNILYKIVKYRKTVQLNTN